MLNKLFKNPDLIKEQTLKLIKDNASSSMIVFCLAWTISLLAADPKCGNVELGLLAYVLPSVLGVSKMTWLVWVGLFYLLVAFLFRFTGYPEKLKEVQTEIMQPYIAPGLLTLAISFLGIMLPITTGAAWLMVGAMTVYIVGLAIAVNSLEEICENP